MMKKWVIEVTANFADKDKYPVIDQLARTSAANLFAAVVLIADGQKPDVICYSDDFYDGRNELDVFATPVTAPVPRVGTVDAGFSDEFLKAMEDK